MQFKQFLEQNTSGEWKAAKSEILSFWDKLPPNIPLSMEVVPPHHKGTRYGFDGIRLTGSSSFINAILSRLKDILPQENYPYSKLDLEYRQIVGKNDSSTSRMNYAFYVHVVPRNKRR